MALVLCRRLGPSFQSLSHWRIDDCSLFLLNQARSLLAWDSLCCKLL